MGTAVGETALVMLHARARWSPSDFVDALTCAHRATLEREVRAGRRERPAPSGEAAVVARRGLEHAERTVAARRANGRAVTVLQRPVGSIEFAAAVDETRAAMAAGAEIIVDATIAHDGFRGTVDLLERVPGRSVFGAWTYEVVDVRLAAHSEAAAVLQACACAEALAATCETAFDDMNVGIVLADGTEQRFPVRRFAAIYRAERARFLAGRDEPAPTSSEKIPACARCRWQAVCSDDRQAADDVSLVAGITRMQARALRENGIASVAAFAAAPATVRPRDLSLATWDRLHDQATLQAGAARDGVHRYRLLPPEARSGFAALPEPSPGDITFDMEGDPFVTGGLEYLFGLGWRDAGGTERFRAIWAHSAGEQLAAVAEVLAFVRERREEHPGLHVYHYAPYERTALARLTVGTAFEAEVEALFRDEILIDLYAIVRGALRVSTPSYSIKALELLYRGRKRTTGVADAMGSVVTYEEYLRTGDAALLEQIREYNQDDCDSTRELHDWLLLRKAEALAAFGPPEPVPADEPRAHVDDAELAALRAALTARATTHDALLGELLAYHQREARPKWREYFERLRMDQQALLDDPAALAGLVAAPGIVPQRVDRSFKHALDFPLQPHALRVGDRPDDSLTRAAAGEIVALEPQPDGSGRVWLKRGPSLGSTALPRALIPKDVVRDDEVRNAIRRFARLVEGGAPPSAQRALLHRDLPRRRSGAPVDGAACTSPDALAALIDDLDRGVLVVQGPPGTGKTWTAARAVVTLLQAGRRVGVAAGTHKAINNLLNEIERVAVDRGYPLRGCKRSDDARPETLVDSATGAITNETDAKTFPPDASVRLIAGTPALFAREAMAGAVDVLVVDEAGQLALADALAIAQASDVLVLAGDPQQLPHVTVGQHPGGAGVSVLAYLLDGSTVAAERGVFLPCSFRMHPAIADFVSELMYDGRLQGAAACASQRIVAPSSAFDGAGLRTLAVSHAHRTNASPEEAAAIVDALRELAHTEVVDGMGRRRPFVAARDAVVVAPYNAQVACIRAALAAAGRSDVRVGTVDKFQGQEATVVLYSMTTSSGDDVPHDVEFLLDRNRLNVAVSRARTLVILVHAPDLLALRPRSVDQLALLNALARFSELATPLRAP